jgi:hypothetical protein
MMASFKAMADNLILTRLDILQYIPIYRKKGIFSLILLPALEHTTVDSAKGAFNAKLEQDVIILSIRIGDMLFGNCPQVGVIGERGPTPDKKLALSAILIFHAAMQGITAVSQQVLAK